MTKGKKSGIYIIEERIQLKCVCDDELSPLLLEETLPILIIENFILNVRVRLSL